MKTHLILNMGGRGGVGKTVALLAIADYLQSRGFKFHTADCDTENAGKFSSFSHWFDGKTLLLNLRNTADCDKLLSGSASSGAPFVLADLPSNASGDIASWWQEVVTPETLQELNLSATALGVVTPQPGSAESVLEWIDTLGSNIQYLVALNRLLFERVPGSAADVFADWFSLDTKGLPLHTFEIPHLHRPAMDALIKAAKLPSRAIKGTEIYVLMRSRIRAWVDRIHAQLDALGLFASDKAAQLEATK